MQMPKVKECSVTDCAYNKSNQCHALAITVGDTDPRCDTFCRSSTKGGSSDTTAGVGACKVTDCSYNENLECAAPGIVVGYKSQDADCLTFRPK